MRQVTFWSPPHLTLLICALAAGAASLSPIVLARSAAARTAGAVPGLRHGPLVLRVGSLLAIGGLALDLPGHQRTAEQVAVLTGPHAVVGLSVLVVIFGGLLTAMEHRVCDPRASRWQELLVLHGWGLIVLWIATAATEYVARPNLWHGSEFYQVGAAIFPVVLVTASRSSMIPWGATLAAATYMTITLLMVWLLPLFPVQPRLEIDMGVATHIMPPTFPLLLVFPSIGVDLWLRTDRRGWRALVPLGGIAVTFELLLLAAHWPFADFLLSPLGRHDLFAADQWPYHARPGSWQYAYWTVDVGTRAFALGVLLAILLAAVSAGIGLGIGNRLRPLPSNG